MTVVEKPERVPVTIETAIDKLLEAECWEAAVSKFEKFRAKNSEGLFSAGLINRLHVAYSGLDRTESFGKILAGSVEEQAHASLSPLCAWIMFDRGDTDEAVEYLREQIAKGVRPLALQLALCRMYLALDDRSSASELLSGTVSRQNAPMLSAMLTIFRASAFGHTVHDIPNDTAPEDLLFLPDEYLLDGLVSHYNFGTKNCLLLFDGFAPVGKINFWRLFMPIFRKLGLSVVTVADHRRDLLLPGFGSSYPDRQASQRCLEGSLGQLGYDNIATCGYSGGGLPAQLYGAEMEFEGVLSFDCPTFIPSTDEPANRRIFRHLKRFANSVPVSFAESDNLAPIIAASPKTKVHHYFSKHSELDSIQANNLSSVANVQLFPQNYSRHGVWLYLNEMGQLDKVVTDFMKSLGWRREPVSSGMSRIRRHELEFGR